MNMTEARSPEVQHPDSPKWSVSEALAVWLASVLLILILPSLFLLPYLQLVAAPAADTNELLDFAKNDPTAILVQLAGIIPAHLITLLIAWLVVTRFFRFDFRDSLGWQSGGFRWWHHVAILSGFFGVAAVVGYFFPEQDNELLRILKSSREAVFVVAVVATFTAPVVEEVVYRGLIYSAFQARFGVAASFVFTTLLFAVVHVPQYYPSLSTIFLLTLLSIILTLIRIHTGNLLPCIILHFLFNGLQSALLIAEPYVKQQESIVSVAGFLK